MTAANSSSSATWRPGLLASRAQSIFVYDRLFAFVSFLGATLLAVPIAFFLESLSDHGGWRSGSRTYLASVLVLVVGAFAVVGLYRARSWRQSQVGSIYYCGAQETDDLDRPRVRDLLASSHLSSFDAPFRSHSDQIYPGEEPTETLNQVHSNLRILLGSNSDSSPTNLVLNLPWDLAVALGTKTDQRMVQPRSLHIWHLLQKPENSGGIDRFFRRLWGSPVPYASALVDVAWGQPLVQSSSSKFELLEKCETARDSTEVEVDNNDESPPNMGLVVLFECTGTKMPRPDLKNVDEVRYRSTDRDRVGTRSAIDSGKVVDPIHFAGLAQEIAKLISVALKETDQPVYVCATLPKPVAFLVGYCLKEQVSEEQLGRLELGRFDTADKRYDFNAYWKKKAGLITTIVNLTPHPLRVFDEFNELVLELPTSRRPVRLAEARLGTTHLELPQAGVEMVDIDYGNLADLPAPASNTGYVVSRLSAIASERSDLLFPVDEVRNSDGAIVGCRRLGRIRRNRSG